MDENYKATLIKQQYRLYNDHSAVKLCGWLKESLVHGRNCYKQDFYGIQSHRCLQMTPSINECTHLRAPFRRREVAVHRRYLARHRKDVLRGRHFRRGNRRHLLRLSRSANHTCCRNQRNAEYPT